MAGGTGTVAEGRREAGTRLGLCAGAAPAGRSAAGIGIGGACLMAVDSSPLLKGTPGF